LEVPVAAIGSPGCTQERTVPAFGGWVKNAQVGQ
jgi:hypothetical protein